MLALPCSSCRRQLPLAAWGLLASAMEGQEAICDRMTTAKSSHVCASTCCTGDAGQLVQSARCPVAVLVTDAASQSSSSERGANAALGTSCGLHKVRGALAARPGVCLLSCADVIHAKVSSHMMSASDLRRCAGPS